MATNDIGRVTPIWRGFYSAATTYELNDIVIDTAGSVWWHKSEELTTGVVPAAGEIWDAVIDMSVFSGLIQAAITTAQTALAAAQAALADVAADMERAETAADNAENSAAAASESAAGVGALAQAAAASAEAAAGSATGAAGSAQAAAGSKSDAEAYAVGKRGGEDVGSTDPTYHNNAKYYVEQAASEAEAAAQSAEDAQDVLDSIPADYSQLSADVGDLKTQFNDVFVHGKNLLNPDKTEIGFISAYDGRIDHNTSYLTSDFVPVEANQSITISPNCRKFLAYDAEKNYIQSSYINAGVDTAYTFTATVNGFIRISYLATNATEQIEYGNEATAYEAYKITLSDNIPLNNTQKAEVNNILQETLAPVEDDITIIKSALIEEKTDIVEETTVIRTTDNTGYINQNGAIDLNSTSYFYSDYLAVNAGDLITAQTVGGTATPLRYVAAYNESKTVDATKGWNNSTQSFDAFVIPNGVKYVRVTLYVSRQTTQIVKVTAPNANVEYYANTDFKPVLKGKKWVACGDSFTQGDFSGLPATDFQYQDGKYVGKNKVYPYVIGLRTGAEIVNEAISGSTMAYVDGNRHEFSTPNGRYTQIPNDAEYITLYFGINDSHQNVPIGTIDDNTNMTFYGAWNIVMQYLIANYPDAKIGIIISNGCDTIDYPNAEIAIAKKYGVSYLDMNSDYKVPILFRVNGKPETDASIIQANYEHYRVSATNGHPNVAMHEYESTIIQNWLESL